MEKQWSENGVEAGCDEAGRGCLAGPVFAAAVILPENFKNPGIDDSKKLNENAKEKLRKYIQDHAIAWAVASISPQKIDKINILNASILAMHYALQNLNAGFENIAVDGNRFKPFQNIPHNCIVKGDSKLVNIAAASILAKTYRDDYMRKIHQEFPIYNWKQNKGYPTVEHRKAIEKHGVSPYHRMSFKLLASQSKLTL